MATAGGTPPNGASPKPKRELTPEQKRTYGGLAVVGVLALIVAGIYLPGMLSGPPSVPTAPPTSPDANIATGNSGVTNSAVTTPTGAPGTGTPLDGSSIPTTISAPATGAVPNSPPTFLTRSRIDPFQPALFNPPPAPTPLPPDPEINVTAPNGFGGGTVEVSPIADPRLREAVSQPLNIGSPSIPRLETATAPRDAFPLPRTGSGEGTTGQAPQLSYDKRLAGIVIGDGVRALLELPSGDQRVVQPGDEVEGIRVLNIERFRQGDRTISRMLIRDTDGSQKYVELKASANPPGGGEGGLGGGVPGGEGLR